MATTSTHRRRGRLKRLLLAAVGWLLVAVGVAALVLPGPGLLALVAGLMILSQEYEWAERRVEPVKVKALAAARRSVESWPRIGLSLLACAALLAVGVAWGMRPDAPAWWPLDERWWLPGGWGTGGTLIFSGLIALVSVVYSFRVHRPRDRVSP
jgi:Putative transmembrane protein (PGPGW)